MKKRGISAVVATVLIILITVAAVTIIWVAIIPMIQKQTEFGEQLVDLSIETVEGYTVWDEDSGNLTVQVSRGADEENLVGVQFIFTKGGNSETYISYEVPKKNQKKTYLFDLSSLGEPDSISIAGIFDNDKIGEVTSEVTDLPEGNLTDVGGTIVPPINGTEPEVTCVDGDGDGFNVTATGCGVVDCDDTPVTGVSIYPEATDVPFDGIDQDCDGGDNLVACGSLDVENAVYFIDNDIIDITTSCFIIEANNITLDMKGYSITNIDTDKSDYGIYNLNAYNYTTIKNGGIYGFGIGMGIGKTGMGAKMAYYGNFTNLTITASGDFPDYSGLKGIDIMGTNNSITNNNISNIYHTGASSSVMGIYLEGRDNMIEGNIIRSNIGSFGSYGIEVFKGFNNNFNNNIVCGHQSPSSWDFRCGSSEGNTADGNTFDTNAGCEWVDENKQDC